MLGLLHRRWRRGAAQQQLTQYMERVSGGRDSAASSNLLFAPLPMMVFDLDTEAVLWSNDSFLQLSGLTDKLYESHLDDVIPDFDTHWLLEGKRESPELVTWNHRQYRVFGGLGRHEELPGSRQRPRHDLLDGRHGIRADAPDRGADAPGHGHRDDRQL